MEQLSVRNQPEKKIRAGAICATIWKNEQQKDGKEYSFHSISLERSYKDKDGNWKHTASFRVADLPKAALVLNKAYEYLALGEEERE
jgi:hypothetical protein